MVCLNMFTTSGKQLLSRGTEQWRCLTTVSLALTRTSLEKHKRLPLTITGLSILDRVTFIQEKRAFPARKKQLHWPQSEAARAQAVAFSRGQ